MNTCFLVLGVPRSGTSLVAGILHYLGIKMGEYISDDRWDFPSADDWNSKGFFQDNDFVNFGGDIYGFPPTNIQPLTLTHRLHLKEIINKKISYNIDWGMKEPTILFYLNDFIDLCSDNIKYIILDRDINKSIQSWQYRMSISKSEATDFICMMKNYLDLRNRNFTELKISFDDIVDFPQKTITHIANFVNKPLTQTVLNFPDSSLRNY